MTYWLDDAATGLAQGRITRRSVLLKGGTVAVAAAFERLASPVLALGAIGRPSHRTRHPCVISRDHGTQVTKLVASLKFKGKPLTLHTQITQALRRPGRTTVTYHI